MLVGPKVTAELLAFPSTPPVVDDSYHDVQLDRAQVKLTGSVSMGVSDELPRDTESLATSLLWKMLSVVQPESYFSTSADEA